jgi:transcriptional regulator with XRE-family HTH domain
VHSCHKHHVEKPEVRTVAKPVGQVIRELREASAMTRSEVARKAKIDPSVLSRLERPKEGAQPSFDLVRRVAKAIGVSLSEVSDAIERPRPSQETTPSEQLERISRAVDALKKSIGSASRRSPK